jgi:hypothetical protein
MNNNKMVNKMVLQMDKVKPVKFKIFKEMKFKNNNKQKEQRLLQIIFHKDN